MLVLRSFGLLLLFVVCFGLVLVVNGALPGIASPTLGQGVWTVGFGQSYANQLLLSLFADNFGVPRPAAISFGLAGAYPTGILLYFGMAPADAYATMVLGWLLVAFAGAFGLARRLGLGSAGALLAAAFWLCSPIVVIHAGYSMLALGMALLPAYFLVTLLLVDGRPTAPLRAIEVAGLFVLACLVAVFMDGYTFLMFAVGAAALLGARLVFAHGDRRRLLLFALPGFLVGFGLAYLLYTRFEGVAGDFGGQPLEAFRDWGVDPNFLVQPTRNTNWIADLFKWSVLRPSAEQLGDASVWTTTYSLPLLLAGLVAALFVKGRAELRLALLAIALFGFYMALGPYLKLGTLRADLYPADGAAPAALLPTGNAWISQHLPGFRDMRSSYRWVALGSFGLFGLLLVWLGQWRAIWARLAGALLLLALVVLVIPNPDNKLRHTEALRADFVAITRGVDEVFRADLRPGELVAFLPYRNDFLVNFLAARLGIRTYNIGGDKNLEEARSRWPAVMNATAWDEIDSRLAERATTLLDEGLADAVVLPFIDLHRDANEWPWPPDYREALLPFVLRLEADPHLVVERRELFAIVRRAP